MFDNNVEAIRADVVFNAVVGKSVEEIERLRQQYVSTIGQMDEGALRASIAQEKLAKAISRNGVESLATKRATLAYREEMGRLDGQVARTTGELGSAERSVSRFGRGMVAGSGILGSFRRAVFFASSSLLGGFGLTYAIKSTVDAAERQQVALGHVQTALKDTGLSYGAFSRQIEAAMSAQVRSTGFTNTELAESLAMFIRRYGDVNQALRANAIAADVARAKNVSLADAQTLVLRAGFGNPRSLRILGIELQKTTANYDALVASNKHATQAEKDAAKAADLHASELASLNAVQQKYGGNAARFLTTTAGKQQLFNAEIEQTKEIIGQALLPSLNSLLGSLTSWLGKSQNQARIQRDVNEAVHDAAIAAHVFASGVHLAAGILGPFNRLLGGTKNSVELLTAAMIAWKARGVLAFVSGAAKIAGLSRLLGGLGAAGAAEGGAGAAAETPYGAIALAGAGALFGGYKLGEFIRHSISGTPTSFSQLPKGYRTDLGMNLLTPGGAVFNLEHGAGVGGGATHRRTVHGFVPSTHRTSGGERFTDVIPSRLQLAYARAQLSGNVSAQQAALGALRGFLEHELALARTDAQRLDITQQLISVQGELKALTIHAATAQRRRITGSFAARESAFRAAEDRAAAVDIRMSRRTGVTTHAAEARIDRSEQAYLRAIVRNHHATLKVRQEANSRLASLEKHLASIDKHIAGSAFGQQAQAFIDDLSGAIRQYAGNIEQHFHEVPAPNDPHAAHKTMRRAARAAFN